MLSAVVVPHAVVHLVGDLRLDQRGHVAELLGAHQVALGAAPVARVAVALPHLPDMPIVRVRDDRYGVVPCGLGLRGAGQDAIEVVLFRLAGLCYEYLVGVIVGVGESNDGIARLDDAPLGVLPPFGELVDMVDGHRALLVRVGFLSRAVPRACAPQLSQCRCSYRWTLACTVFPVAVMVWPHEGHASSSSVHMPRWGMPFA